MQSKHLNSLKQFNILPMFCSDAAVRRVKQREGKTQYINRTRVRKKEGGAD